MPVLNQLARELKGADFETVETLWSSGIYEERLLAAKLIGRLAKKQPREAWETIQRFTPDISDWPTCDTLATESVRPTLELLSDEIAECASNYVQDDREWIRRFGLVLLTNFVKAPGQRPRIEAALNLTSADRRLYVRKASDWLLRDLSKIQQSGH